MLAIYGTSLNIAYNPKDKDTYISRGFGAKGHNELHINTLYDIENHIYTNCLIQDGAGSERQALLAMLKQDKIKGKNIIIADRGYESYNILAHFIENDLKFVVRFKDITSSGILKTLKTETDEFDVNIIKILTDKQSKQYKDGKYTILPANCNFDYLDKDNNTYTIDLNCLQENMNVWLLIWISIFLQI